MLIGYNKMIGITIKKRIRYNVMLISYNQMLVSLETVIGKRRMICKTMYWLASFV